MVLDIRGGLKNTKINGNVYVAFEELLSNSIDSYLIRKNAEPALDGLKVEFLVEFFSRTLDNSQFEFNISCSDNGGGFGDEQVKAYVTKDTSYKDDLTIEGIGKCKGSGRIQFLHYFSKIKIDSTYKVGAAYIRRRLAVDADTKEIDEASFLTEDLANAETKTICTLDAIRPDIYERFFQERDIRDDFCASALKSHLLIAFLQRFVSLKDRLGNFAIKFKSVYQSETEEAEFTKADLPEITLKKEVTIHHKDANGNQLSETEVFTVSHYKLSKTAYRLKRNLVALCAKASTVKIITNKYLKSKALENHDIDGFYHIILIESSYLDSRVNEHRDNFNILSDSQIDGLFFKDEITWEQIHDAIDDVIDEMITPPDWDKGKIIKAVAEKFGVSSNMIAEAKVRVRYADTEEKVVKRVLDHCQAQIIKDTSEIFDIKEEISKLDPTSEEFRKKVNDISWKFTSSLKSIDMANLSQLIVRRAAILDILGLAIGNGLVIQTENDGKKYNEKIIHNIFFPMGKDSTETIEHDVWMLSEEYQYFDYIASDKSLAKIKWGENDVLFESDIDDALAAVMKKNVENNSLKRPDIAIFSKEGSAIIIEFKAPGVDLDEHTNDLMEYAHLLAAKSKGKLNRFYGYLIGTQLNPIRLRGYKPFPSGKGWFGTEPIMEHSTSTSLGELYSEILYYGDIVDRANKRLNVYKERLKIDVKSADE